MYDVAIIGAGIIGASIARELSKYNAKIILLDRSSDISTGATKANSAIVHAGFDAPYQSKKGIYNARGNAMYGELCEQLSVPFKQIGSLVCAFTQDQVGHLESLLENGKKLNIPGLEIIDGERVREMEPHINPSVVAALWAPTAGITEPWELAVACAENAIENGVELRLNFPVDAIKKNADVFSLYSRSKEIKARCLINCAGTHADCIAKMLMDDPGYTIKPRRGEYYLLDKPTGEHVHSIIFPVPTALGKGVLVVPTVDNNLVIGPNAEDLNDEDRDATETTFEGLSSVRSMASSMIQDIPYNQTITVFSGLRAETDYGDFIIGESKIPGFIEAAGIKSPGLSAAPAIAVDVAEIAINYLGDIKENPSFNPVRRPRIKLEQLSIEEKAELIKQNPQYGNVICRCEMITEGEIVDAIHRKAGATTVNGVKRRVRPGSGRCQGGFCGPRVVAIIARELSIPIEDVRLEEQDSVILTGKM